MNCPVCRASDSRVVDSRLTEDGSAVRRRRECESCGRRFTTYERLEAPSIFVIKKDGRREPFEREKILAGLTKACEKRPVAREEIERCADEIEQSLRDRLATEVATSEIGEMVMARLRALDEVAYVRFASVYKEFRDADSFVQEIERLANVKGEE
jgi:transcriptional repressor NrdR